MRKRDTESNYENQFLRKQEEIDDIRLFLEGYARATGEKLVIANWSESPDAICRRPDGTQVGVEITEVRRSPSDAIFESIYRHQDEMDPADALDEIGRLIMQKGERRKKFRTDRTVLVLAVCEADFDLTVSLARDIPIDDVASSGFDEVWLADFKGVREGAHREVRLFGLHPAHMRAMTNRSMFDQKPYG